MLKELFNKERSYLNAFFDALNHAQAEMLLQHFEACKGLLIFSGVGKSGLIAKKIVATMNSIGVKAFYLSPTNGAHGDLGIVHRDDLFIFISKSGESDELLQLVPSLRNRGVKLAAIVSNSDSRIAKACDIQMLLPVPRELCPHDLVPVTSTTIQLIFGNVMAIALMKRKHFSLDDFAVNHPSGRIGKRLILKVQDLMIKEPCLPICKPSDLLVDVLVELSEKKCGCILVTDEKKCLTGIFTDGDLRRALQKNGGDALQTPVESLMSLNPKSIQSNQLVVDAIKKMEENQRSPITVLPVIDSNKLVGLIKMHDIIQSGL